MSRFERAEVLRAVRAPRRVMFMSKLVEAGYRPMQAAEINAIVEQIAIDLALDLEETPREAHDAIMCASAHRLDAEMAAAGFAPAMLKEIN